MFGFLQKHHNSQLQKETSATAVSVVLNALWTSQTFKSSSSKRDIRSNLNYKLWSVHSQTFHIENSSSTDDTRWNQNCATWLISQRYIWYGSRNKGKTIHTTRPYQRVSEATKAPCGNQGSPQAFPIILLLGNFLCSTMKVLAWRAGNFFLLRVCVCVFFLHTRLFCVQGPCWPSSIISMVRVN